MKFSTLTIVFAAALCLAGCKYDKAKKGAGADGDKANATQIGDDGNGGNSGLISGVSEGKFEDLYARCTDVNFEPVYFGFDSSVVPQGELSKIEEVASHLKSNSSRVVVVEGNCDERGSKEYNMVLGENRAQIIRNYLVQNGIGSNRIQTRSYGSEKPAVDGHDESAYSRNRRGEFAIFDTAQKR